MTPCEFTLNWNKIIPTTNSPDMKFEVVNGDDTVIWPLRDRVLKYKRIVFDDCYLTLHVSLRDPKYVSFKIGLIHGVNRTNGPQTTHWQTLYLNEEDINNPFSLYAKLIIASANLTRQGKIEPYVCTTLGDLIHQTLGIN